MILLSLNWSIKMPNIPSDYEQIFVKKTPIYECSKRAKFIAVISYFSLLGWVIAMIIYDKTHSDFASFHLRQSIGLIITGSVLLLIPLIGWLLNIAIIIAWFIGLCSAIKQTEYKIPLLGDFYQKHLDFIQ